MTWEVVTNGSMYRLRNEAGHFYKKEMYIPTFWGTVPCAKIIEFSSKEEAISKAKSINWYPIEEKMYGSS